MQRPYRAIHHPGPVAGEGDGENGQELPFRRFESIGASRRISYYLSDEIGAPIQYSELLYTLHTASESDVILLHLNSPGGSVDTGVQIINNVAASSARVITILESRAYSMAALIFLTGDEIVVHDNCQLMFHNYSGALMGKGNEQQAQVLAVGRWFEKTMYRVCHPFLTMEEITGILRGEDIWMDSDEVRKRLSRLGRAPKPGERLPPERLNPPRAGNNRHPPGKNRDRDRSRGR